MTARRSLGACALVLAALATLVTPDPAASQARRGPPARQDMERQVRERFHARIVRELSLTAEQGRALAEVIETFQVERAQLVRREVALRQRLRGTGALLSEGAAREVLDEMATVQEAEASLLRREQERLLEVLTPPQVVRLYTLRAELADRIRRMRGGGAGAGRRSGPAGAPAGRHRIESGTSSGGGGLDRHGHPRALLRHLS
jgi:Spy/CpxP family protein refolding chaperone